MIKGTLLIRQSVCVHLFSMQTAPTHHMFNELDREDVGVIFELDAKGIPTSSTPHNALVSIGNYHEMSVATGNQMLLRLVDLNGRDLGAQNTSGPDKVRFIFNPS